MTGAEAPLLAATPAGLARRWQLLAWLLLLALLAVVGAKLVQVSRGSATSGAAPLFTLASFDGTQHTLQAYRGKVVVVNFWASWCAPCAAEAADLEQTWQAYRERGVVFLGVDYVDTEPEARAFIELWQQTYPNGPDRGTVIAQAFRIRGVPETYIIDQRGQLQAPIIGPTNRAQLSAVLDRLLAQP